MRRILPMLGVALAGLVAMPFLMGGISSLFCARGLGCLTSDGTDIFLDADDDGTFDASELTITKNAPIANGDEIVTGNLTISGTLDVAGAATGLSWTSDPSATPTIVLNDSDSAGEVNDATIAANATDAGGGTEDVDLTFSVQVNSTLTPRITIDADGGTTIPDAIVTGSLNVPNGATPTLDAPGEVAIDTDAAGVGADQLIYYDGAAVRAVVTDVLQVCHTIEDLAAADDDKPFWMNTVYTDTDLVSAACVCVGTCTTEADVGFEIAQTGSATVDAVTGSVTCEDQATGDTNTALSGTVRVDQYDLVRMDVTNTPDPATDDYVVCLNYRVVVQ